MLLLAAACALLAGACAFNLDVKHASVFSDPEGQSWSYFGFTVSLLKETGPVGGSWLLVGAPRGNSTYTKQDVINQPGVVYQCKLGENREICKSLVIDSKGETRVSRPNGFSYHDKRDQGLLGTALEVQGTENGRIVVCAPRWKNRFYEIEPMNGICYWLNGSKTFDIDSKKLIPLVQKNKQGIKFKEQYGIFREPNDVFYFVYGGAGMSINFVHNSSEMIIGAPGVFDWMGTVIRYRDPSRPLLAGDGSLRAYTQVFIPNPFRTERFTPYSYFGYSVGSGHFFNSAEVNYVSGAPRAGNLKGMVYIFDFPDSEESSLLIKIAIEGFQMGEYFGSCICVIDLNSDQLDDLVVGAPQHSVKTSSALQRTGDEGRIYVFINNGNGKMNEIGEKNKIMGLQIQGARFGTSISNLGDLNNDGFPDIAVGAPYENSGHGAVYIYQGRFDGINPKYVQRITAKEIDNSILGFGFSISKGSDVDENNCLDLAVGAYESGHAVLLKSLPIVTFHANLATNVKRIQFDAKQFFVKACISYTGKYVPERIVAEVTLRTDPTYGRALFKLDSGNVNLYSYKVTLNHRKEECKEFTVEIIATFQDFSKPIEVKMEYQLIGSTDSKSNHIERKRRDTEKDFCKTCPVVDPAAPSHVTHRVPYATGCGDDDICRTNIKTDASLTNIESSFVIGTTNTILMKVAVKNTGDPAFLSQTNITIPNITPLVRIPRNCKETVFSTNSTVESGLQCEMGNPLTSKDLRELILEFDAKNIPPDSEKLVFKITSGSTGEELEEDDNAQEITVPLKTISDLSISGRSSQDHFYLVRKKDSYYDKVISFSHLYEVHNFGPSPVNKVNITFKIPVKVETSSGTLHFVKVYQPQVNLNNQPFSCIAKGFEFHSDKTPEYGNNTSVGSQGSSERREISLDENRDRRKRRNAEETNKSKLPSLSSLNKDKTLFVSCSDPEIECKTVECIVGPFTSDQTRALIVFPLKVPPEVIVPVLEDKDLILVSSSGMVEALDFPKPFQPEDQRPDFFEVHTFLGKLPESKIAPWIIALAIIGGLLILLLLVLGLIKMGFFKRDKKEELENLKHKSEMEESLTANMRD